MRTITLKTLPEATAQEVFDQIKNHLLSQNKKSKRRNECVYHSPDGLKCAAGCLISENEYNDDFEGKAWSYLSNTGHTPKEHIFLIMECQSIHDHSDPTLWAIKLEGLAKRFDLKS